LDGVFFGADLDFDNTAFLPVFEAVFFVGTAFFLRFGFKIVAATPDKSLGAVGRLLLAGLVDTMPVFDEKELIHDTFYFGGCS
jgi:hypothetical protein